jgi:MFS family permease
VTRHTPKRTLAMISANSLTAAVQAQFMFVLPWMLLARGSSPRVAALATAFVYVPMLISAVPAGAKSDNADPLRLMRRVTVVSLVASALYPLASLAGHDWFWLVLAAAVVVGTSRNFSEAAVFRSLADTTQDEGLLRAHAIRTTVNQAALFGTAFIGLVLFRLGNAEAVLIGTCVLYVGALAILAIVPELGRAPNPDTLARELVAEGMTSWRGNRLLRQIGWVTLTWSMFGGAAVAIMPAVLREHIGMDSSRRARRSWREASSSW